ncbi:hypothetical protein P20311_2830 [Pseudoalteromonas sp. BSi20311]|nr:hypothetical protein P20311_2830 [Pseudoalteromonas sp. BSi20311]
MKINNINHYQTNDVFYKKIFLSREFFSGAKKGVSNLKLVSKIPLLFILFTF